MPSCRGTAGSVRATQIAQAASLASEVQIFWPVSRQPPAAGSARVVSPARSEPAPGSLNSWHQMISPRKVAGRKRACCSGVPYWTRAGTTQAPMASPGGRSPAARISSAMTSWASGPAARPHGSGRCGVTQPPSASSVARLAFRRGGDRGQFRPHAGADQLRLGGQVDADLAALARQRQRGHPLGPLPGLAQHRPQRQRPPVVQVGVVLPGVADAAENLDALMRAADGRVHRHHRGHCGGELGGRAEAGAGQRGSGVPGRGGGLLGGGEHPGAAVLDRLELADRPAELMAHLGVAGGGGDRPVRDAARLGPEQGRRQRADQGRWQAVQDPAGRHGQPGGPHPAGRAGQVQAVHRRDLQVGGVHRHPDPLLAAGHRQDEQPGLARAQHRPAAAVDDQCPRPAWLSFAVRTDARGQPHRPGERARGQVLDQPGQLIAVGPGQHRAGQHRGQEPARQQRAAQFLGRDGQLGQPEALPAQLLGQMQPEQALAGQAGPQRGGVLGRRRRPRRPPPPGLTSPGAARPAQPRTDSASARCSSVRARAIAHLASRACPGVPGRCGSL